MNAFIIVVLILIIVLVIYLASVYFNLNYLVRDSTPLNIGPKDDAVMGSIASKTLDRPASTRYHYAGWFYINTNFTKDGMENVLFNRVTDFIVSLKGSTLNVYAGGTGPTVSGKGTISPGTGSAKTPLIIIPNFPFQKWVYLVINVDGSTVDLYIDGKFVSSVVSSTVIGTTSSNPITHGNQFTQGNFCRFSRPANTINPQGVWQKYMQGSGQGQSFSKTGVKVQFSKNGQTKIDQRIF